MARMVRMVVQVALLVLLAQSLVLAGPLPGNFIGEGTNELATALLQGFVTEEDNQVFSPLGYSAVLAIFAEGARGESRQEIASALHFPDDVVQVRSAYRTVLERLMARNYTGSNAPEFKNWFYIYKNYSVEEDLQNVLREHYLTEVKVVDRPDDFFDNDKKVLVPDSKPVEEKKPEDEKPIVPETQQNVEVEKGGEVIPEPTPEEGVVDVDKGLASVVDSAVVVHKVDSEEAASNNGAVLLADKPAKEKEGEAESLPGSHNIRDKGHVEDETVETATVRVVVVEEPSEVEAMVAEQRSAMGPLDHASGMTDSSLKIKGNGPQSQMIIFNGLYYRGDWKTPFVRLPANESRVFYKSEKEKISVATIHSEGNFLAGEVAALDSKAIELPYFGGRYSLLLLVPNSRDGLAKLIADMDGVSVSSLRAGLSEKALEVCLPTFEITTLSKPISSLSKLGLSRVTSIFDPEKADLSGISKQDPGLFVEELVQMVSFKVDGDNSEVNFLTASQAASRTDYEKFQVNHPFLFFLQDVVDDIIVVTGKVVDPTPVPDIFDKWEKEKKE